MAKVRAEIALDMRFISRIDGDSGIDVPNGSFLMSYSGPFALTDWVRSVAGLPDFSRPGTETWSFVRRMSTLWPATFSAMPRTLMATPF